MRIGAALKLAFSRLGAISPKGVNVNKGIVALFVIVALLVLVSPGLVGMLAERSVDEQIEWAELENQDLVITAERFDRGWFSSHGRHRIELRNPDNVFGAGDLLVPFFGHDAPALIVDTRLSHGPIALSSIGTENTSLSPGLGKAISTLSLESSEGEVFILPGAVNSSIALNGDVTSNYRTEAGSGEIGTWGDVDITFESRASKGLYAYNGRIESVQIADVGASLSKLAFSGNVVMSKFDLGVGDMSLTLDYITFDTGDTAPFSVGPVVLETSSTVIDDKVHSASEINMIVGDVPGLGHLGLDTAFTLRNVDAVELNQLVASVKSAQANSNSSDILAAIERDVLELFAAGADLRVDRLDIALPQGTITSEMNFKFLENDDADLAWASLLLTLEADVKFEIPEVIANMAILMSPQPGMVESMLVKKGDIYQLEAAYKKGLLTVNGVPMALPIL